MQVNQRGKGPRKSNEIEQDGVFAENDNGIGVAIALASFLGYHLTLGRPGKSPAAIHVSGNIEVVDADVSFKIPGRVGLCALLIRPPNRPNL